MNARELSNQLAVLLRKEQCAMADFLVALADFDQKELWRELGHTSLFYFLRRELGLSAGAAQYRKTAAELIQRFPKLETALRDGRLCLSTVVEVAKVLTPENREQVLPRFFGLSRREAEMVAVSIRPVEAAPRREVVTRIGGAAGDVLPLACNDDRPAPPAVDPGALQLRPGETQLIAANSSMPAPAAHASARRDSVEPLDAEQSRFHIIVSRRFLEKLAAAKDALSHSKPGASAEEMLEAGLDLLLERHAKRKGLVAHPQKKIRPSKTDAIPAHDGWIDTRGRAASVLPPRPERPLLRDRPKRVALTCPTDIVAHHGALRSLWCRVRDPAFAHCGAACRGRRTCERTGAGGRGSEADRINHRKPAARREGDRLPPRPSRPEVSSVRVNRCLGLSHQVREVPVARHQLVTSTRRL